MGPWVGPSGATLVKWMGRTAGELAAEAWVCPGEKRLGKRLSGRSRWQRELEEEGGGAGGCPMWGVLARAPQVWGEVMST